MQVPLEISFRNMEPSAAIEQRVRRLMDRLAHACARVVSCRVMVELVNRRQQQGNLFRMRVDLRVPNAEIVASRDPATRQAHEDVYIAICDAFDHVRSQLDARARRLRSGARGQEAAARAEALPD
ncbi:MAG TPA: HPF/RaiA family ribosome-associated protein [Solimonas sp.]|nr:HPF/RaiA family ribosome-associated protein [Solimonas sp.]